MAEWGYQSYYKYPKDSTFDGMKVLNVGCDVCFYPASNVVNLDNRNVEGVNCIQDLAALPLPFEDKSFDFILANHILEHIPNWGETFKDLIRVLKVGGKLEVWVPADGSSLQLGAFTHINTINQFSFHKSYLEDKAVQVKVMHVLYDLKLIKWLPKSAINWMIQHLRNVAMETQYVFQRVK